MAQSQDGDTILIWQFRGTSHAVQGSYEIDLPSGCLTFLDLDQPYAVQCPDGFGQVVIHVRTDDLRDRLRQGGVTRDFRARVLHPQGLARPWLSFLSTALLQSQEAPGSVDSLFDASMWALSELAALTAGAEGHSAPEEQLCRSAIASLRKNYWRDDLTADLVAEEHNVSRRTLFRALATSEATFSEALQDIRLDAAAHMLRQPALSLTVDAVARAVGYASPSSFHARFSERFGKSPGTYRGHHFT